jgi:antitoxin component of MazEF toxin-antitoxin module
MYMSSISPKLLYVRRMGNSLHVTLPADVVREFDSDTGYAALMSVVPHGIKLKFMNTEELTTLMNGGSTEHAEQHAATEPAHEEVAA